jgi:hypothetical protein
MDRKEAGFNFPIFTMVFTWDAFYSSTADLSVLVLACKRFHRLGCNGCSSTPDAAKEGGDAETDSESVQEITAPAATHCQGFIHDGK